MTYSWRYAPVVPDADAFERGLPPSFASQSDAESWLGETWRELAGAGVTSAALLRDGDQLYSLALVQ